MFCWTWRRSWPSTTYSLSSRVASLASSSSVRSRARLSGSTPARSQSLLGQERPDPVDVPQRDDPCACRSGCRHREYEASVLSPCLGASRLVVGGPLSPAAACGGGSRRSRTPCPGGGRSCSLADALHAGSDLHRPRSLSRSTSRRAKGRPIGPSLRAESSLDRCSNLRPRPGRPVRGRIGPIYSASARFPQGLTADFSGSGPHPSVIQVGQDPGAVGRHGHGVLEVGAGAAVLGLDGPCRRPARVGRSWSPGPPSARSARTIARLQADVVLA